LSKNGWKKSEEKAEEDPFVTLCFTLLFVIILNEKLKTLKDHKTNSTLGRRHSGE